MARKLSTPTATKTTSKKRTKSAGIPRVRHVPRINLKQYDHEEILSESETVNGNVNNIPALIRLLESNKKIEVDMRPLCLIESGKGKNKKITMVRGRTLNRSFLLEAAKKDQLTKVEKLQETDAFAQDVQDGFGQANSGSLGNDFTPLLGGPFNKQLYQQDYMQMHSAAFYAVNHDPLARFIVDTYTEFALGRGWKMEIESKDPNEKIAADALWKAFEEVNDLTELTRQFSDEMSTYGEQMVWWLPGNEVAISFGDALSQLPKKGIIPRVRLIDPSCIWEIVTYPEDIRRVLFYQWIAPTQYQSFTGRDGGASVPTAKFIWEQIPGHEVDHYKIKCASNEKRGRSMLFPILGYLKRLRDAINFSLVADLKNSSWAIDTTVEGDQADINSYVAEQAALGTFPPAGSEFVHTDKIKREYRGAAQSGGTISNSFDWNLSMISVGSGIPVSYLGTHLSGGQTRASAIVSTEPFAKKVEGRQQLCARFLTNCFNRLMKQAKLKATCRVIMPEVAVQDRSAKLKDISLAQTSRWISRKTAAEMAAQELQINKFDFKQEQQEIEPPATPPEITNPLSTPPKLNRSTGIGQEEKRGLDLSRGQ